MFHEFPESFLIAWKNILPRPEDRWLFCRPDEIMSAVDPETGETVFPRFEELPDAEGAVYLFELDGEKYFTRTGIDAEPFSAYEYKPLSVYRQAKPKCRGYAACVADQLWSWYRKNRWCGICGRPTVHSPKERMMYCPECKSRNYPVLCPSVIVGITRGDELLVTTYSAGHVMMGNGTTHKHTGTGYALVAGYVETGEAPEDTVRRECMEEVGLEVENIRYYKSQPWPINGSLLFGYFCDVKQGQEIRLDREELSRAVWLPRNEVPNRGDHISLTSEMMDAFREGRV